MIEQVQQLVDRAEMYAGRAKRYRRSADLKFGRVMSPEAHAAGQSDEEFSYMNPDLDNWDAEDGMSGADSSQVMRKDFGCLSDMGADESLDLMIETIGKMPAAGATRAEMDNAWSMFNSAQS
jgi:hypothetical protein